MGVDRESICNTWDIHTVNKFFVDYLRFRLYFILHPTTYLLCWEGLLRPRAGAAHAVPRSSPAHSSIFVLACELRMDFTSVNGCKKKQQRREKMGEEEGGGRGRGRGRRLYTFTCKT